MNRLDWSHEYGHAGITVRDYFAAAAMQGLLSCQDFVNDIIRHGGLRSRDAVREQIATWAWMQADAMLAAREPKADIGTPPDLRDCPPS